MVRGRWEGAGKSEEQNLLSEKSSSPRHRRRPLHTLCSSLFLPRPRPTTSRDPFRPRHQSPPGALRREACRSRRCEFDTRSCVPCGLAENGSQYVHNKIYTEMSTLARTRVYVLLFSVSRERASAGNIGPCVCTCARIQVYAGRVCFQRRNPRYRRGFHVSDTRPPCSRSLNTISSFNRGAAAQDPFSLFPPRTQYMHLFRPADKRDVARRRRDPRMVLSTANGLRRQKSVDRCESNHVPSFRSRKQENQVTYSDWFESVQRVVQSDPSYRK